jgi:uncharacterized transporter YbjL
MSEDQTETNSNPTGHALTIIAGLVVLVCLVGAAVALALAGWSGNAIMGLLTGIIGVAGPLIAVTARLTDLKTATDAQTLTLAKIDHQTNGVLNQRIKDAVHSALNEPIELTPVSAPPATEA